jgi:peroxiredoxin
VAQLRRERGRSEAAGLGVVLVGMGSPEESQAFRRRFDVPFPLVCDPEKRLYTLYGLGTGKVAEVLSPRVLLRSLGALGRGHVPGRPQGDVLQMPGAFVIDRDGTVLLAHYSRDPADHPAPEALLAAAAA